MAPRHDQQGSDVLAALMHEVGRASDAYVASPQKMTKGDPVHRDNVSSTIVRLRRAQDATTIIIKARK